MKRLLAVLMIVAMAVALLCGCEGESAQQTNADRNRFAMCKQQVIPGVGTIVVVEDTTTGVRYICLSAYRYGAAVTPLIDENGSPLLSDKN